MDNRKTYDSNFCGSVPLNSINVIQSYGYLLVLDKQTLTIIQASENVAQLFGAAITEITNQPISAYIAQEDINKLISRFEMRHTSKLPQKLTVAGHQMHAITHLKSSYYLLELEQIHNHDERTFSDVFEEIKYMIAAIESAETVEGIAQAAVAEVKKLSGFDGVMMYQFDSDWNGTVIAEEKETGMENYLGHTFPASDVPKQARAMYLTSPYRLIPDSNYQPVRLYPVVNPETKAFIDLSDCNIRGVAAVHLEYLKNMNVQASMSIRVLNEHRLWGLIACHHRTPHPLSFEMCSMLELLSAVISNKIAAVIRDETYQLKVELNDKFAAVAERIYRTGKLKETLLDRTGINLLDLFNAEGAVVTDGRQYQILGQVPDADFVENLVLWLQHRASNQVYHTDSLATVFDEAGAHIDTASGLLAIPINSERGTYAICFRPEILETIKWGGDPNQAVQFDADGKTYHPRHSFKLWLQTVRQTAASWKHEEITLAENLRNLFNEFRINQSDFPSNVV